MKWKCSVCGYIYDEDEGDPTQSVPPNTAFDKLSENWACPICNAPKDFFEKVD